MSKPAMTTDRFTRSELDHHDARSSAHPWAGALFGCILLVLALSALGSAVPIALGWRPGSAGGYALAGLVFAALGVSFLKHAARMPLRAIRRSMARSRSAGAPWLADYPWKPSGVESDRMGVALCLVIAALVAMFLVSVNYEALLLARSPGPQKDLSVSTILLVDLVGLLGLGYALYLPARALKYGRSRLELAFFPYFVGYKLDARLVLHRPVESPNGLTCTLRCVEEVFESRRAYRGTIKKLIQYQIYTDSAILQTTAGDPLRLPVSFEIPAGGPASNFCSYPVRYWEIEVCAETAGVDYRAVFPVPVYTSPQ